MNEQEIVKNFSDKMLAKIELRHNRYAPLGWKTLDPKRLLWLLEEELRELKSSPEIEDFRDELIDIANYCMFLYEKTTADNG